MNFNPKDRFSPIYSKGRDLWVCHSFEEEKAHRIGIINGNQSKELYVVYVNPSYIRHHRCNIENVFIVSLFEFAFKNSRKIFGSYDKQIRFIQNHLNLQEDYSLETLLREIKSPSSTEYEIYKSELMEALGIMKIQPQNEKDLFHYLTSMNLLNAWINNKRVGKNTNKELFRDMYSFKSYLSQTISFLLLNNSYGAKIFIQHNFILIELNSFQFSFHNIPLNETLKNYMDSEKNEYIKWKGNKLQPISPLLFRYSKELNKI